MLRNGKHHSLHFQRAWDKYGEGSFKFTIYETIDTGSDEEDLQKAKEIEQEFLDIFMPTNRLYNKSFSANTGVLKGEEHPFYNKHPKEWMGVGWENLKKRDISGEKNPFYGKHHSEKTKDILRQKCANFGEKNGFYGKKHSEETKKKISKSKKGIPTGKTPTNAKKVEIDGIVYESITEAAKAHNVTKTTITQRIRRESFPTYKFYGEEKSPTIFLKKKNEYKKREKGLFHHSEETKKILSAKKAKKVLINGVEYPSVTIAAKELKVDRKALTKKLKSEEYPDYKYL